MRVVRMLHRAALAAFVLLLAAADVVRAALTAQNGVGDNRMLQVVTLARQPFLKSLSLSLCMLAALAGIHVLLEKIGGRSSERGALRTGGWRRRFSGSGRSACGRERTRSW